MNEKTHAMVNVWKHAKGNDMVYGHPESYQRPADWFDEVGGTLEDWGCGTAAMRRYVKRCKYVGIDGTQNPNADRCGVDLRDYRSDCDCVLLRGVIDHNVQWEQVLANALDSFRKRMVVMIFHDLGPVTKVLFWDRASPGVPDMQFCLADLMKYMLPYLAKVENIPARKGYRNNETLFYLEKK